VRGERRWADVGVAGEGGADDHDLAAEPGQVDRRFFRKTVGLEDLAERVGREGFDTAPVVEQCLSGAVERDFDGAATGRAMSIRPSVVIRTSRVEACSSRSASWRAAEG